MEETDFYGNLPKVTGDRTVKINNSGTFTLDKVMNDFTEITESLQSFCVFKIIFQTNNQIW